jgi:hypothetical protein
MQGAKHTQPQSGHFAQWTRMSQPDGGGSLHRQDVHHGDDRKATMEIFTSDAGSIARGTCPSGPGSKRSARQPCTPRSLADSPCKDTQPPSRHASQWTRMSQPDVAGGSLHWQDVHYEYDRKAIMEMSTADAGQIASFNPLCKATSGADSPHEQRKISNQGGRPSSGEMSLRKANMANMPHHGGFVREGRRVAKRGKGERGTCPSGPGSKSLARQSSTVGKPISRARSVKEARGSNDIHGEGSGPSQSVTNSSTAARTVFRAETSSEKRYSERPQ